MKVFTEPKKLQKWAAQQKRAGRKIALVPTMGCLHEGHLSLIKKAKDQKADEIIVSVFVNPVQFCPGEDYEKYPRDEKADLAKCKAAGATAIFFPTPANMYLENHSVYINEELLSKGLCGARRPGHFRGVCTVVAKLFNLAHPDFAVFGQKDYQQAQIIKRMVRDLNFDLDIIVAPIVREKTGLARSSRNTYLSEKEKEMALAISRGLKDVAIRHSTLRALRSSLESAGLKVDYVEAVDAETLEPVKSLPCKGLEVGRPRPSRPVCVLVAAYCGKTRLIDNIVIK